VPRAACTQPCDAARIAEPIGSSELHAFFGRMRSDYVGRKTLEVVRIPLAIYQTAISATNRNELASALVAKNGFSVVVPCSSEAPRIIMSQA
jgi:hypothetical protein